MIGTGNPILDEIDQAHGQLSPAAQKAIALSGVAPSSLGAPPPEQPAVRPLAAPPVARGGLGPTPSPAVSAFPANARGMETPAPAEAVRPMGAPAAKPLIQTPEYEAASAEHNRLTNPTLPSGKSGVSQIHNPFLRTLARIGDVVGTGLFPGITMAIPGTELHHNMLVHQNENLLGNMEGRASEEAQREHLGAETAEIPARAEHERAQAEALRNPPEKADKAEAKTVTTDQGVMQWNPDTQRYDIKVGDAKAGKETGTVHQLEDGTLIMAHPDGSATGITINGQPAKGKIADKAPNQYGDFKSDYLKSHPAADATEIQKAFEKNKQAPERPPHALMVGPDGKAIDVKPGSTVPQGAMTPGGVNSTNVPTAQTRTMAETAPKVQELATRVSQLIDQQAASLGPAASRWSEFMAGKVGAPNPEFTKLRTDVGLLQTALMRMHVGARGGEQMMEHFRNLIDVAKQDPQNLKAALGEIQEYARQVAAEGKAHGGEAAAPTVTTKEQFDALPSGAVYMEDGKKFKKP